MCRYLVESHNKLIQSFACSGHHLTPGSLFLHLALPALRSAKKNLKKHELLSLLTVSGQRLIVVPCLTFCCALQGIDGAGRSSSAQFRRLQPFFDCWTMDVGPEDRSSLDIKSGFSRGH